MADDKRDWFAEDITPILPPGTDIPISYRLTARAYAATAGRTPRPAARRCRSLMPYRTIHGGQSW